MESVWDVACGVVWCGRGLKLVISHAGRNEHLWRRMEQRTAAAAKESKSITALLPHSANRGLSCSPATATYCCAPVA